MLIDKVVKDRLEKASSNLKVLSECSFDNIDFASIGSEIEVEIKRLYHTLSLIEKYIED